MESQQLFTRACEAAAQGYYSEAHRLLDRCLAADPAHIAAHKELAFVLRMTGDMPSALFHRQEVKRLDPTDLDNRLHLANLYFLLGQRSSAMQEAEELLALEPNNKRFYALKNVIVGQSSPSREM